TVVRVTKCDNIGRVTLKPALDAVKRYIGSTYRYFINAGKAFYVNGELVEADDPLWRDHPETTVLLEDTFEYTYPRSDARFGRKETVGCVLVYLPDMGGIEENKRHGLTADRAGFYVMRNRRQIVPASMFGTFTRHPEFNRFRGELLFPATMDRDLGVSFLKSSWDIRPSQSLKDKIESEVGPYMRQARKLYRKMRVVADDQISHDEAAKTITQRSPFLRKPRSETERRATESKGEGSVQPKESSRERYPLARAQAALADRVRFETRSDGPTAPFYEATLDGRRVVIAYNVDHAFYERFLVENRDNRSLVVGIDYLVYSLATAEILARDDDTYEFLRRMREDMSFNLRQLLTT
ncbi:MAG: hypothetical protein ACRDFS_02670, partial [Chloroflexota bacterium]